MRDAGRRNRKVYGSHLRKKINRAHPAQFFHLYILMSLKTARERATGAPQTALQEVNHSNARITNTRAFAGVQGSARHKASRVAECSDRIPMTKGHHQPDTIRHHCLQCFPCTR